MAMLIESVCQALGRSAVGGIVLCRARKKTTSKNLKTEHIYFSDSNYFVWKRVNTITLTTELGGFKGLTGHCFPREQRRLLVEPGERLGDPGGCIFFHFLLRNALELLQGI